MEKKSAPLAEKALQGFAFIYLILCLLMIMVLPSRGLWYLLWRAGGMAAFAAIAAVFLFELAKGRAGTLLPAWRHPGSVLCLVWFVWSCIACLLAAGGDLGVIRYNSTYLFDLAVSLLLLFPLGIALGGSGRTGLLERCIDCAGAIFAVLLVIGLILTSRGGSAVVFGRDFGLNSDGRLALGTNTNGTGAYCLFFFWAGVYRLYTLKSRAGKLYYTVFCCMNLVCLVLSDSRTSILAMAAAAAVYLAAVLFRRTASRAGRAVLTGMCVLGCLAALALGWLLLSGRGPALGGRAASIATLSGRTKIWQSVIAAERQDRRLLLQGVSPALVISFVKELVNTPRSVNTHNQFLEILVGQGAPALVLFTVWLLCVIKKSFSLLSAPKAERRWVLPLLLAALLVANLGEATLVCLQHYVGGMFFLIAGYVGGLADGPARRAEN